MEIHDELPVTLRGKVDWDEIAETARQNPGKWVEVPVPLNPSLATQIRRGGKAALPPEEFEVTTRTAGEKNRSTLYVRAL